MRIAIANAHSSKIGGAEGYLDEVIPELHRAGYRLSFLYEYGSVDGRPRITLPDGCPRWCVGETGVGDALHELERWRPELIYVHEVENLDLEARLIDFAPSLVFVHGYRGTCISGSKTFRLPIVRPCGRRFGPACLCLYFPRRCGGNSPVTMFRSYSLQTKRLRLLRRYCAIVTHSEHMRDELLKHGFAADRVYRSAYISEAVDFQTADFQAAASDGTLRDSANGNSSKPLPSRLLFVGRMEQPKGGDVLLDSLPEVVNALDREIEVAFVGDGRVRGEWERRAARIQARDPRIKCSFKGWLSASEIEAAAAQSDLLVVPSLWPEPFGRVGLDAARQGLPAAAFAVGGIPEWLIDGVGGFLASADPPTSTGLAEAIAKCIASPEEHARLRLGAYQVARRFSIANHIEHLSTLFRAVVAT